MQKEYLYVVMAGLLSGGIVFGGALFLNMGVSVYELSFLPYLIIIPVLLPFIILNKKHQFKKNMIPLLIFYALSSSMTMICQFIGVALGVPVAMVTLLLYTQPVWTITITYFFLKEKITKKELFAVVLVFLGIIILVNPFNLPKTRVLGIFVSLFGGISLSGWIIFGSLITKKGNSPINTKFSETLLSSLLLFSLFPLVSYLVKDPVITRLSFNWPAHIWTLFILYGLVFSLMAHMFYYFGVKKVPTVDAGIIMLLEPIVAAILSVLILKQPITLNIFIGGALILFANYLVIKD